MNLNEALKECSALKGKLTELKREIDQNMINKTYEGENITNIPTTPIDDSIIQYCKVAEQLETLKERIYRSNVKTQAVIYINDINYCKSILPLLKSLSSVKKEEIDMEGGRFGQVGSIVRKTANFDITAVKTKVEDIETRLRRAIAELDRINFLTELE